MSFFAKDLSFFAKMHFSMNKKTLFLQNIIFLRRNDNFSFFFTKKIYEDVCLAEGGMPYTRLNAREKLLISS